MNPSHIDWHSPGYRVALKFAHGAPATCALCGQPIEPGTMIVRGPRGQSVHLACRESRPVETPVPVPPRGRPKGSKTRRVRADWIDLLTSEVHPRRVCLRVADVVRVEESATAGDTLIVDRSGGSTYTATPFAELVRLVRDAR